MSDSAEPPAMADQPDLTDVDEVWLGNASIAGDEFVEALNAVADLQESLRTVQEEFRDLDVGLDRDDAVALIWGRSSLNKGQIKAAFEVIDIITTADLDDIGPRLMADRTGDLTIAEAGVVWDEIANLAEKYGSLNDDADRDQ